LRAIESLQALDSEVDLALGASRGAKIRQRRGTLADPGGALEAHRVSGCRRRTAGADCVGGRRRVFVAAAEHGALSACCCGSDWAHARGRHRQMAMPPKRTPAMFASLLVRYSTGPPGLGTIAAYDQVTPRKPKR